MIADDELMEMLRDLEAAGQNQAGGYEWGTGANKAELQARDLRTQIFDAFAELRAERDLLREAVKRVEFVYTSDGEYGCPWCGEFSPPWDTDNPKHAPDCPRQRALVVKP